MGKVHVERARALLGTRFRPQGRGAEGVDCVGLILIAFGIAPDAVRRNYMLRGAHLDELQEVILRFFRKVRHARLGDLLLLAPSADQYHLAIHSGEGHIHADAGLRRVVETPGAPRWPIVGIYRRLSGRKGS